MGLVDVACEAAVDEPLQLELEVGEDVGVDQLAQLLSAEQITQQVAVERQRCCPPLGEGRVARVHVHRDPPEHEGLGEGRRLLAVDRHQADLAAAQVAQHLGEGRDVEHVVEALAGGFEEDRERRVLAGHRQQVGGALALLPERRPLVGAALRQQQRSRGALAEAAGEHRRGWQLRDDELLDLVGVDEEVVVGELVDRLGEADDDPVVAPHQLDRHPPLLAEAVLQGHRPRGVHLGAERRQHADAPVADLVAEPLHHDGAVVGHDTGGLGLLVEVGDEVGGRPIIEPAVAQALHGIRRADGTELTDERPDRSAQLQRSARPVAVPERHLAGLPRRGRDDDLLERDVLDAPGGRAEEERLAGTRLVDHLLVELADPRAVRKRDREQPPVGDGAGVGDGEPLRAGATSHGALDAVPHDAGAQLGELLGRVAAGQQVEHGAQHLVGQVGERRRPADHPDQVVHGPLVEGAQRHDLLAEHIERVARVVRLLDLPGLHPLDHHRGLEQVGAVLREELAAARRAHLVPGPADTLEAGGHRARRLHLDDEVDRPHVDAELEAGRGHEPLEPPRLELVFDLQPPLA